MDKMKKLVEKLNHYRNAYYNENQSIISDKEYDLLFDKLVEMERKTGIVYTNSPTQTVGYTAISQLKKVVHNHPLQSLGKTTDIQEFYDYFKGMPVLLMAKMDGLTCSLLYKDGKLVRAESRGDGETGEDITHNARVFTNLPAEIPFKGEMVIDGECIITRLDFERINKPLIAKAEEEATALGLTDKEFKEYVRKHSYANPRNLVSGSVRQLDSSIVAKRNVRFVGWKLHSMKNPDGTPYGVKEHTTGLMHLEKCGFEVVSNITMIDNTVSDYEDAIEFIKNDCEKLHYPIDGMVGIFDDIEYGANLGRTGHHPRHSLAFKFYQDDNETTLLDIEWSTSRTGLINPVAILEPVEIDGTTVSRASLCNVSIIKELELGIGDTVTLIKANQIIPQITGNLTRSNTYQLPTRCPNCGGSVVISNSSDREMMYCTNKHCAAKIHDKISNFASREAMNIVGISEERLRILMEHKYITDFASLYNIHQFKDEIAKIDGFGKVSVENLIAAIEASRECKFANLLVALGIPGIGKSTAKTLAKYCIYDNVTVTNKNNLLEKFLGFVDMNFDWSLISGFGEATSNGINEYVIENRDEIEALIPIVKIIDDEPQQSTNKLGGKTFCITGKLIHYENRDALVADIEKFGGKIVSNVTAKTNYLITNDTESGSGKNQKARQLGTQIITEQDFIEMCG